MRKLLVGILGVTLVIVAIVLAIGEFRGQRVERVVADETALTVAPIMPAQVVAQEAVTEPSQDLMSDLYEAILPSVVNIQTIQAIPAHTDLDVPGVPGLGSGWIWDTAGHIVTNNHVVENATEIIVFFYNGLWAEAQLVATAPQADLAVLQVPVPADFDLRPLPLAAESPSVGLYTLAFGSPFGLSGTMTKGIISALGRAFPVGEPDIAGQYSLPEVVQTDTAINPGNSGGPLVNLQGEVIGVNFAIRSEVRANAGVGFAIPVSIVERVVPALIEEGEYNWPFLGIGGRTIDAGLADLVELPENVTGVFVNQVTPRGPAAEAGLQEGDIITAVDGQEIFSFEDLTGYLVINTTPGDTIELAVLRDGELATVEVSVGTRP